MNYYARTLVLVVLCMTLVPATAEATTAEQVKQMMAILRDPSQEKVHSRAVSLVWFSARKGHDFSDAEINTLSKKMASSDQQTRLMIIECLFLSRTRRQSIVDFFFQTLESQDEIVKLTALRAILSFADADPALASRTGDALKKVVKSSPLTVLTALVSDPNFEKYTVGLPAAIESLDTPNQQRAIVILEVWPGPLSFLGNALVKKFESEQKGVFRDKLKELAINRRESPIPLSDLKRMYSKYQSMVDSFERFEKQADKKIDKAEARGRELSSKFYNKLYKRKSSCNKNLELLEILERIGFYNLEFREYVLKKQARRLKKLTELSLRDAYLVAHASVVNKSGSNLVKQWLESSDVNSIKFLYQAFLESDLKPDLVGCEAAIFHSIDVSEKARRKRGGVPLDYIYAGAAYLLQFTKPSARGKQLIEAELNSEWEHRSDLKKGSD